MDALLSVDLGTTGCKAAVCTAAGRVLGTSAIEYPLIHLEPGFVEQDADLWWSLTLQVIRAALDVSRCRGDAIRALSVSTQGISFVPIDRSGKVLRNAINWLDTRAVDQEVVRHQKLARSSDDLGLVLLQPHQLRKYVGRAG